MEIEGRVAIVTGAGADGTGRAIALALAGRDASVVVGDIDPDGGRETVDRIEALGARAAFVRADVRVQVDIRVMAAFAEQAFGGLDILVNNAGNTWAPHFPDCPPEHWEAALDLNLRGPMFAIQVALGAMRRRGGGAIVNVSSVAGLGYGTHDSPEYAAAEGRPHPSHGDAGTSCGGRQRPRELRGPPIDRDRGGEAGDRGHESTGAVERSTAPAALGGCGCGCRARGGRCHGGSSPGDVVRGAAVLHRPWSPGVSRY
jgi:hypothetical protein